MAKPQTLKDLKEYCLRKLGHPVLEINVADEQIEDCIDDALQLFHERHFDGVERMYLKYRVTKADIDRGNAYGYNDTSMNSTGHGHGVISSGISTYISGYGTTVSTWMENSNYLSMPDSVIGVEKIFKFDTSSISAGMFSIKYQLFLNDLYYFNSVELLQYAATKSYLEDIDFLLTTDKQIRFNKRQNKLYLDLDWGSQTEDTWFVLDCYRILDPASNYGVYNDSFLKRYATALIKKQWGQNLIKFRGVKLPGGLELNGREIYDDAEKEIDSIRDKMMVEYEMPPYDFIG